jgi:hypothetical protein
MHALNLGGIKFFEKKERNIILGFAKKNNNSRVLRVLPWVSSGIP